MAHVYFYIYGDGGNKWLGEVHDYVTGMTAKEYSFTLTAPSDPKRWEIVVLGQYWAKDGHLAESRSRTVTAFVEVIPEAPSISPLLLLILLSLLFSLIAIAFIAATRSKPTVHKEQAPTPPPMQTPTGLTRQPAQQEHVQVAIAHPQVSAQRQPSAEKHCYKCGRALRIDLVVCPACGARQEYFG
jgi:hypothetical protein